MANSREKPAFSRGCGLLKISTRLCATLKAALRHNRRMAITIYPKAGMVLVCDFHGYRAPEIIKRRPIVVISPNHLHRPGLCTVVPLSTTPPVPLEGYHVPLPAATVPGGERDCWAKCDLVATVCRDRLDRVRLGRGEYRIGYVSTEVVNALRRAAALSFGVDSGGKGEEHSTPLPASRA